MERKKVLKKIQIFNQSQKAIQWSEIGVGVGTMRPIDSTRVLGLWKEGMPLVEVSIGIWQRGSKVRGF